MITGITIILITAVIVYGWWKLMDRVEDFRDWQATKQGD